MINERKTFEEFGYDPNKLSKGSDRKVWAICEDCKKERLITFRFYRDFCPSCRRKGKRNHQYGKTGKDGACYGRTGDKHPMFGKHHTEKSKQKISDNNPICGLRGKDHPSWKHDKTDEERNDDRSYPEYIEWRKLVYERDNYTCQICGKNKDLNAHHLCGYINNINERTLLENGITLCVECHKNFHHQYGKGKNTKLQFIEFTLGN